jgi:hypothetical protein
MRAISILFVTALVLAVPGATRTLAENAEGDASVTDIIAQSSTLIANATSVHFNLKVEGDSFVDDGGAIRLLNASGQLLRPDRVSADFQVQVLGAGNISVKVVTIGSQSWTTDIITGRWTDAPPEFTYDPSVLFDTQHGIGPVMDKMLNPKLDGTEEIGGRDAYKVSGTASKEDISELTSGNMIGEEFPLQLWVDQDTGELLQIVLAEPEDNGKENPATWTMKLSGYNDDVEIDAPV